jgi:hypothetical protein
MILNYNVNAEDFEDAFELVKYRIRQDNQGFDNAGFAVQSHLII